MLFKTIPLFLAVSSATFGYASNRPDSDGSERVFNSGLLRYPSDITRNIVPKPIHSHNDYWRDVPFYTALSNGCISVEADVWLFDGTLYVGHRTASLTPQRTFKALYVDPILRVLESENPTTQFNNGSDSKNGVFDSDGSQTLYLFVDVKTVGQSTFPAVIKELQPLRDAGYLTTYNSTTGIKTGPVTVIGTGNTPLDQIVDQSERDYFFDVDLAKLNTDFKNVTGAISPIASTNFAAAVGGVNNTLSPEQIATIEDQIALAKSRGMGVRYWDTPGWPIATRDAVWRTLLDLGVSLLNADDLEAAASL